MSDVASHLRNQLDFGAFHKALVRALCDPFTLSGRQTKANLEKIQALTNPSNGDSYVLDARFELGRRNEAYLQAPVLPLQTSDTDTQPLGMRLDPVFEKAHQQGIYRALIQDLHEKKDPYVVRLEKALWLSAWLLTIQEVHAYVKSRVNDPPKDAALDLLEHLEGKKTTATAQIAMTKFVNQAAKQMEAAGHIMVCLAGACGDGGMSVKSQLSEGNSVANAVTRGLCTFPGIHQISFKMQKWRAKKVDEKLQKKIEALEDLSDKTGEKSYVLPFEGRLYEAYKSTKTNAALLQFYNEARDYRSTPIDENDTAEVQELGKKKDDLFESIEKDVVNGEPAPDNLAYNMPMGRTLEVETIKCLRPSTSDRVNVAKSQLEDRLPNKEGMLGINDKLAIKKGNDGKDAAWVPQQDTKGKFANNEKDAVAIAVSEAAILEEFVENCARNIPQLDGAGVREYLKAVAKIEQLQSLKVCVDHRDKFDGTQFVELPLPVRRCRMAGPGDTSKFYKFVWKEDPGTLNPIKLEPNTVESARDFESQYKLRDFSQVHMPKRVKPEELRAALEDGIDATEEVKCNEDESKELKERLRRLEGSPEDRRVGDAVDDGDDPCGDDVVDLVDLTARKRRRDVWSDGLREAALANDKLYGFARQLGGAIGEPISEVAVVDDSKLAAESKQIREARQRAAQRAADQHADLVKSVIAQVMKDSQLTLGIGESGSFSGMNPSGSIDLSKLKVVSGALRREASELAGLGKDGETDRFFGNAVKLESLLRSGTGEMTFSDLLAQLRVAGQQLQIATQTDAGMEGITEASASIEFLSTPRNSLMLRWRPEALSAVRESYAIFQQEMRTRHGSMVRHQIAAYELIEGRDGELTTLFATLCGLKMASSRLHSSSQSAYTSQWAAVNNSKQLAVALARVCRRACHYVMNCSGMGSSRLSYHR